VDKQRVVCDCDAKSKWGIGPEWPMGPKSHPRGDLYRVPCKDCLLFHWHEDAEGNPILSP